jgi:hypothetical protein
MNSEELHIRKMPTTLLYGRLLVIVGESRNLLTNSFTTTKSFSKNAAEPGQASARGRQGPPPRPGSPGSPKNPGHYATRRHHRTAAMIACGNRANNALTAQDQRIVRHNGGRSHDLQT